MNVKLKILNVILITFSFLLILSSCANRGDARKTSPDPDVRVAKNLEEGRGFRLSSALKGRSSGEFDFASSNELWRASLDTLDFMPLVSANYSGGIIITDWYSEGDQADESIKISIRFLTNEIRADAVNIKVFYKNCNQNTNCRVVDRSGKLSSELKRKILELAALYKEDAKKKNFKKYPVKD